MTEITINNTPLSVKEYQGKRVVTFKDIDTVHGRPEGTARKRFNDNKEHFIESEDFYTVDQPSEIRTLGITRPQGGVPASVTLITESGYLMLVKSFTDDLAWDVQRQLVNSYFRTEQKPQNISPMLQYLIQMEQKQNELEAKQAELEKALDFNRTEVIKATLAYGRIGSFQQQEIQKTVRLKAIEECHTAQAYDTVGKSVINAIYKALQQYFDIPSYKDLRINQMTEARAFILDWVPHPALRAKIVNASPKPNFDFLNVFTGGQE